MWPSATNRRADRALTAAIVAALALAHVAALMLVNTPSTAVPAAMPPEKAAPPVDAWKPVPLADPAPADEADVEEIRRETRAAEAPARGGEAPGSVDVAGPILRRLRDYRVYPMAARRRGVEGDVVVRFALRADGSLVAEPTVSGEAHPLLARAAVESVVAAAPFPVPEGVRADSEFVVTIAYRLSD